MRINHERHTVDIEPRDTSYILNAYVKEYNFLMKGEDPKEIIFPMPPSIMSSTGATIPVRWVSPDDPLATEIVKDGSNIPEAEEESPPGPTSPAGHTGEEGPASPAVGVTGAGVTGEPKPEDVVTQPEEATGKQEESPAKAALKKATEDRKPKIPPGGDIGPGAHPDNIGSRDPRADIQIRRDLIPEPEVDEGKELPVEIEKPTDEA